MSTQNLNEISFEMPKNKFNAIKVIGVGGGGSNAVDYMYQQEINGVDFIICNTDAQALENSPIANKIQLGVNLTEGMGAGANPDIGEKAAEESYDEIRNFLKDNTKMVFITAGMGGGTGTGAAPVIARIAQELDLLTVGIVTMPFEFEGKSRNQQAQKGISALREYVDSLIVINNNKLRDVYGNLGYKSGFAKADEVLSTAAKAIAEVITHHYKQNIDLNDAKTVLMNSGTAIMGSAKAKGEERSRKAIEGALDSPLLNDNKITGAKNVLLLIVSGENEVTLDEIGEINDHIRDEAGHHVNIIMGVGDDHSLEDQIAVTVIATGFSSGQQEQISETEVKKIVHTLEDNQEMQFDLFNQDKDVFERSADDESENEMENTAVIHSLGEEETNESLSPTTQYIKDIEVVYEEISPDKKVEREDTLVATTEEILNIDVLYDEIKITSHQEEDYKIYSEEEHYVEEEIDENQMKLTFEFDAEELESKSENVVQDEILQPDFDEVTTHNLADYEETNVNIEPETYTEVLEDENLQFELLQKEEENEDISKPESSYSDNSDHTEITPLNASIAEFEKTSEKRKSHLKKYNYTFHNSNSNIDEIEKEPAYKRQKVELSDTPSSDEDIKSRLTIDGDKDDGVNIRSNNSFLHDNVD